MNFTRPVLGSAAASLVVALWLAWLWQPERQVRWHTAGFLGAIQRRNDDKMEGFIAEEYSDRWGHDKRFVITASRQVFQQFVFLTIEHQVLAASLEGGSGRIVARVKISGQGGPVAEYVMGRVNGLAEPFAFVWRKRSGRPWDWELISVEHPSLEIEAEPQF
jgi:hypothetical protein